VIDALFVVAIARSLAGSLWRWCSRARDCKVIALQGSTA
jgi:hypothetical protein